MLAAQAEACDQGLIPRFFSSAEVVQQFPAAGDHTKEATACAVILGVAGKVTSKVVDAISQANDLNVGAASVSVVKAEGLGVLEGNVAH